MARVPRLEIVGQFLLRLDAGSKHEKSPRRGLPREPGQDKRLGRGGQVAERKGSRCAAEGLQLGGGVIQRWKSFSEWVMGRGIHQFARPAG